MASALQIAYQRRMEQEAKDHLASQFYPNGVPARPQSTPVTTTDAPYTMPEINLPKLDLSGVAGFFGNAANAVGNTVAGWSDPTKNDADQQKVLTGLQSQYDSYITAANDTSKSASDRVMAAESAKSLKTMIDNNPLSMKKANSAWFDAQQNKKLTDMGAAPIVKPGAPTSFGFGPGRSALATAPVASAVKPKTGEIPDVTGFLAGQLGEPVTITSGYRDPSHNADVGGVKGSAHTELAPSGAPMAYDFKPSTSSTKDAAVKLAQNLAGQFDQIIDEGDHVHVSFDPKGRGQVLAGNGKKGYTTLLPAFNNGLMSVAPTQAVGDTTHYPSMLAMDPSQVGAMIPNARMLPHIKMPAAPQQDTPSDLTPHPLLDEATMLASLKDAMAVKPRDASHDTWDRFASLLTGAAGGAVEAGRAPTMGQLLLNAGAGAGRGYKGEVLRQKGEQDKYDEMVRQANIALAQQGFQIKLDNYRTTNANIDRSDTSKENKRQVKWGNAKELFDTQLKGLELNSNIDQANVGAGNSRDMARASAVIGATQGQATAQNETNLGQTKLNLETGGPTGTDHQIVRMLSGVGLAPTDEKNPHMIGARGAAMGVLSDQPDAAANGLAHDLVYNGGANEVLAPAKGDPPEVAKAKSAALRAIKTAKKPEDAQAAVQTLAQLMTSDHVAFVKIAKTFAGRGYPSAKIIMNGLTNSGMSAQDKKAYGIN